MSEKPRGKISKAAEGAGAVWNATKGKIAVLAILGAAGSATGIADETNPTQQATQAVTTEVATKQPVRVLEGGNATAKLGSGKLVKITNPILTENGVALERTTGTAGKEQAVTPYLSDAGNNPDGNAQSITYTEDGKPVTQATAIAETTPVVIEASGDHFVVDPNQPNAGTTVAQSTPEHEITVTKTVPDN